MADGKFIAYYRVSTKRQGQSGLGLEAQKTAVKNYLNGGSWDLVGEVVEVESGKRSDRPELAKALRLCRLHGSRLVIAKLDRLARNVHFITSLQEAGVKFVCADMPDANEMTVHILAAVAQGEAKAISDRTKVALSAAKERGVQLGGLRWDLSSVSEQGRIAGLRVRQNHASKRGADLMVMIEELRSEGAVSLRQIAAGLNARNIGTARCGQWSAVQVQRVLYKARA